VFASLTDWLDGWIARRYHQYSAFGAFLDPVADKLMVAVALVLTVQDHHTIWMALWASVIIGREIAVSALREWMAELGQRAKVAVATVGKVKTIVQMVALGFLLLPRTAARHPGVPGRRVAAGRRCDPHVVVWIRVRAGRLAFLERGRKQRC
jgi:CDP-diacylglycerol--glycerol-3-phosphate 3-phosphatidyltransferase